MKPVLLTIARTAAIVRPAANARCRVGVAPWRRMSAIHAHARLDGDRACGSEHAWTGLADLPEVGADAEILDRLGGAGTWPDWSGALKSTSWRPLSTELPEG